ncbi:hypothetical protein C7377_0091 [Balneicella halophila]|uniref:6-phosphogluconate dehydrogenase n=1 Tax=Balneicella halophila TaxID=1537566 RepID=A0A7L4UPT9_BALHA|nr:6-phosphogluconate dehydrogenase [Balneicella halophila]PVX51805.1 hypothetical protein C7377_0091 [Balneicella halophila]
MKRILILLALILVLVLTLAVFANYSKGYRSGIIMKMSRKGYVIKTYEGQLNTGGFSGDVTGGDMTSMIWNFSVRQSEKRTIEKIEEAVDKGKRVKLYYEEKYIPIPFWGETKYFVDSVELINP